MGQLNTPVAASYQLLLLVVAELNTITLPAATVVVVETCAVKPTSVVD